MQAGKKRARRAVRNALAALLFIFISLTADHAVERNAISYSNEGWDLLKKGDHFRAIFSFKNALNKNPKYKEALIGLGNAFYGIQAYEQAYDLYSSALKLEANSVQALTGMGFTEIGLGNYTGAMKFFDRALEVSQEKLEVHYGIAYLYTVMGKNIWAKRKLESVFRINPYHFNSLLLMADIKGRERRLGEAKRYIEKAIESESESPKGHTAYGEILLRDFLVNGSEDSLSESVHSLRNALSIQPKSYDANRLMGIISLIQEKHEDAVNFFKESLSEYSTVPMRYCLAVSYDRAGKEDEALASFLQAVKMTSQDSILKSRLEDFLLFHDYKIGHPARVMLDRDNYDLAMNKAKKNLHEQVVMYLRRSLLMNPLNKEAREHLMDYYLVNDFYDLYIDEIKELQRSFKEGDYRNRLSVAIMKRRDRLYHREGYSVDPPARDVPRVLVFNLDSEGTITAHPDAGEVIASHLTFTLQQFGRMEPVGIRNRVKASCGLACGGDNLYRSIEKVQGLVKAGELQPVDYIVYGTYREQGNIIAVDLKILDNGKGFVIGEFSLSESGKDSLPLLSLRSARQIYGMIPYKGRILKIKEKGVIVNLGLFDGMGAGERMVVYKFKGGSRDLSQRRKIVFTVKEADTFVSYAETQRESDLELLDSDDIVYPLQKRRAKRIR